MLASSQVFVGGAPNHLTIRSQRKGSFLHHKTDLPHNFVGCMRKVMIRGTWLDSPFYKYNSWKNLWGKSPNCWIKLTLRWDNFIIVEPSNWFFSSCNQTTISPEINWWQSCVEVLSLVINVSVIRVMGLQYHINISQTRPLLWPCHSLLHIWLGECWSNNFHCSRCHLPLIAFNCLSWIWQRREIPW